MIRKRGGGPFLTLYFNGKGMGCTNCLGEDVLLQEFEGEQWGLVDPRGRKCLFQRRPNGKFFFGINEIGKGYSVVFTSQIAAAL
ncbi:MAG TPA: hypothetical protein QGF02_01245 [Candidatus Babeliales bacterium]|nr:hypothetical protein [Candidatus Babeliales bacterium]